MIARSIRSTSYYLADGVVSFMSDIGKKGSRSGAFLFAGALRAFATFRKTDSKIITSSRQELSNPAPETRKPQPPASRSLREGIHVNHAQPKGWRCSPGRKRLTKPRTSPDQVH